MVKHDTMTDNDVTEQIAALRRQLRKISEQNQGQGSMQVHRDPVTLRRVSECHDILDELEEAMGSDTSD